MKNAVYGWHPSESKWIFCPCSWITFRISGMTETFLQHQLCPNWSDHIKVTQTSLISVRACHEDNKLNNLKETLKIYTPCYRPVTNLIWGCIHKIQVKLKLTKSEQQKCSNSIEKGFSPFQIETQGPKDYLQHYHLTLKVQPFLYPFLTLYLIQNNSEFSASHHKYLLLIFALQDTSQAKKLTLETSF